MPFWDDADYGTKSSGWSYGDDVPKPQAAPEAAPISREEFNSRIKPGMLGADGKFLAPKAGVNFMDEGMTPDEVYAAGTTKFAQPEIDGGGLQANQDIARKEMLNPAWRDGPAGTGIINAVGHMAGEITKNPALMAAATAGLSSYMAPATVAGDAAAATEMGGNATNAALRGAAGYGAEPTFLQSIGASPFTKPVINAAKTLASGGDLGDVARSAAGNYLGSQASGIISGESGSDMLGKVGGSVVSSIVKGGDPLQALMSGGANAAAGQITGNIDGFSDLSPSEQSFITSMVSGALKGKSPTRALIDSATKIAMGEVAKAKPAKNTQTGGWSA